MFNSAGFDMLVKAHGKKKSHLALSIGKKPSIFNDWKAGKSEPKREYLEILAAELQTTPEFLTGVGTEQKETAPPEESGFQPTKENWERIASKMSKDDIRMAMDILMKKYVED